MSTLQSPIKSDREYVRVKTRTLHYFGSTSEGLITRVGFIFLDNDRVLEVLVLVRVLDDVVDNSSNSSQ